MIIMGVVTKGETVKRREALTMDDRRFPAFLIGGLILFWMSGCAFPISQEWRQQAEKDLTFVQVVRNPEAYVGQTVIWGGVIMEVSNPSDGGEITVLQGNLDSDEYPHEEITYGQFIVKASTFLDPVFYSKGRKITVAGEIIGKKTIPSAVMLLTYPVVSMKGVFLWSRKRVWWEPPSYYGWKWDFHEPFSSPYYDSRSHPDYRDIGNEGPED
jgi:outer membrane lipoprotein